MAPCTPVLRTQLNNGTPTGQKDCAVMAIIMGIEVATCGRFRPTVAEVRKAAGNAATGLTMAQWERALRWCVAESARRGTGSIDLRMYRKPASMATLRDDLAAGRFAGVAVDYKVINQSAPQFSGQRTFHGFHALGLLGLRKVAGVNRTTVYDPLYDGRSRNWGKAPSTPQDAPLPVYRDAMAGWAGNDGLFAGFTVAPGTPTPPPPPETDAQKIDRLTRELAAAQRELATVPARIATAVEAARTEERARAAVMIEQARSEERRKAAAQVAAAKGGALTLARAARMDIADTAAQAAASISSRLDRLEQDLDK